MVNDRITTMKMTSQTVAKIEAEVIRRCNDSPAFKKRVLELLNNGRRNG